MRDVRSTSLRLPPFALVAALLALPLLPTAAHAASGDGAEGGPVATILGIVLFWLGIGAAIALLRVILPGVSAASDASAARIGTRALLLGGVAPLLGGALIAGGLNQVQNDVLNGAFVLLVVVPLFLALLAGAIAGIPRLGGRLLRDGEEAGLLKRCLVGAFVLGLSAVTLLFPPVGIPVMFLAAAWLVGIGVGAVVPERNPV